MQGVTGLVCPIGMAIAVDEDCDHERFPSFGWIDLFQGDRRSCGSSSDAFPSSNNPNGERGCCYTPYVIGSIGSQLSPGTTTNLDYDYSFEFFTDVNCTVPRVDEDELQNFNGISASCTVVSHSRGFSVGVYGYCPGETGTGAYEFVMAATDHHKWRDQSCPPVPGARGNGRVVRIGDCVPECEGGCRDNFFKLTCTRSTGPPPPPPTLEDIEARGVVAAPPIIPLNLTTQTLDDEALRSATREVANALAAGPPPPSFSINSTFPPPPPPIGIQSEIAIPVAAEDQVNITTEGTLEREEFEDSFQDAMSGATGVAPDDIIVDGIVGGSLIVEFHVVVPEEVKAAAANIFETLASSAKELSVSVGGENVTVSTEEMSRPSFYLIPLQHCAGMFSSCTDDCIKTYKITQIRSGVGALCVSPGCADENDCKPNEQVLCDPGDGECRDPEPEPEPEALELDSAQECCSVPQNCSASEFSSSEQCRSRGGNLTVFEDHGCSGLHCTAQECCSAPQDCSASDYSSDAECALAAALATGEESGLTAFEDSGCSGLTCVASDCCGRPKVTISAQATFPLDTVPEDRSAFEVTFKESLANRIRLAGGAIEPHHITVIDIRVGSLIVDFEITANEGNHATQTLAAFHEVKKTGINVPAVGQSVAMTDATAVIDGVQVSSAPPPPPVQGTVPLGDEGGLGAGIVVIIIVVSFFFCAFCVIFVYVIKRNLGPSDEAADLETGDKPPPVNMHMDSLHDADEANVKETDQLVNNRTVNSKQVASKRGNYDLLSKTNRALFDAISARDSKRVKLALEEGAHVNVQSTRGTTALMKALDSRKNQYSENGHEQDTDALEVLEVLLNDPRVQVNCAREDGRTALMVAAHELLPQCVEKLLAHGAKAEARCSKQIPSQSAPRRWTAREFVENRKKKMKPDDVHLHQRAALCLQALDSAAKSQKAAVPSNSR
jgi:hypothetical protein